MITPEMEAGLMSVSAEGQAPTADEGQEPAQPSKSPSPADHDPARALHEARVEAAEWRKKAKAGEQASKRLAELEEQGKSDLQKATDRAEQAERRAAEAEARGLRQEVALRKRVPAELA